MMVGQISADCQGFFGDLIFIELQLPEPRRDSLKKYLRYFLNEDGALFWVMTSDPRLQLAADEETFKLKANI